MSAKNTKNNSWHEGSIRTRSDGRIEGRISIDGVKKSVYGKTEAEVKRKIRQFRIEFDQGKINPKTDRLGEFIEKWLVNYKFNELKPSSYDRLERLYLSHIKNSRIANKLIGNINSNDIQSLLDNMVSPQNDERAYARSTAKKVYELLSEMYKFAQGEYDLKYNPMTKVRIPKEEKCEVKVKETFALTPTQISAFESQCLVKSNKTYKYKYGLVFLMMLSLGLRVGEMLALEFDDFDCDNKVVRINKSVMSFTKVRDKNKKPVTDELKRESKITTPKTKRSIRTLPINDKVIFYLNEIKSDNKIRGIEPKYVCSTTTGTMPTARNLQRTLDIIANNAGLPHIWLHILRHTFGSVLIRKKVNISVVSKLMGHASTTITYNTYVHTIEEEEAKAMELLNVI